MKRQRILEKTWMLPLLGLVVGAVRGITEAIILGIRYPLPLGFFGWIELIFQCLLLYGLVITISGSIISLVVRSVKWIPGIWYPFGFIVAMVGLDLAGWMCRPEAAWHISRQTETSEKTRYTDILLISIDTLRADHLGSYGYSAANTPCLDRLSMAGTLFINTITPIPVTTPAHVSMLTGLYPPQHGSRFNAVRVHRSIPLPVSLLSAAGYRTAAFVSAFPVTSEVSGLRTGFGFYEQFLTPSMGHPLLYHSTLFRPLRSLGPFRPAERRADQTTQAALAWWRANQKGSRFSWIHYYDPHLPYQPPDTYRRIFSDQPEPPDTSVFRVHHWNKAQESPQSDVIREFIHAYDGEIAWIDRAIETLMRELDRSHRLENTLIVITADHGESLDEHDYYFSHGEQLYDASLHVPMIWIQPQNTKTGHIIPGQSRITDIMPSIMKLSGISMRRDVDGIDISHQILHGGEMPSTRIFCETGSGVYTLAHRPKDDRIRRKKRAVRTVDQKVVYRPDGEFLRFDLDSNPGELLSEADMLADSNLVRELTQYIRKADPPGRQPLNLPEESALEQLKELGYLE